MDKNLRLAIIGNLIQEEYFQFSIEDFFENELNKKFDLMAKYNYEPLPEVEEYFKQLDLKSLGAEKLESIYFEAGDDIIHFVWNQWDGEDEYFDIQSLDGIEICKNIKELNIDLLSNITDLTPLESLSKLEDISITNVSSNSTTISLKPLLKIKTLKKVTLENINIDHSEDSYLELKEKVDLTIE